MKKKGKRMGKTLSERIAERVTKSKNSSPQAINTAAFIALKSDIMDALNDGWAARTIWETLYSEGKIAFSYQAFRGYIHKMILKEKKPISTKKEKAETPITSVTENKENTSKMPKAFHFEATPNKEDLF